MAKTILAVAIGSGQPQTISNDAPTGVRPYIIGLINYLKTVTVPGTARKYQIGGDYFIDYREYPESELSDKDTRDACFTVKSDLPQDYVIFGMSTTVVKEAANFTWTKPDIKIIGVVSDPVGYGASGTNVCGIIAKRVQHARKYFDKFQDSVASGSRARIRHVYLLNKKDYRPTEEAIKKIGPPPPLPNGVTVQVLNISDPDTIGSTISNLTNRSGGLLILPADWFFGAANEIISAARAKELPDFWPLPDWATAAPKNAFGGYGVSQDFCGREMGKKIAYIWKNNNALPNNKWFTANDTDATGLVSIAAANELGITPSKSVRKFGMQ
jgi:hypothetical protein